MDSQFQLLNHGRPNSPMVNSANAGKNPTLSNSRRTGLCFLLVVISIAVFEYLGYLYVLLLPLLWPKPDKIGILVTALFHSVFILFAGAFIQCVSTDPGTVPSMWGFRVGEDAKRRRYCKVCQLWKPDRTHHCSACGRCVLNMDHHCPWINNCVGFYNRKFFIQLLIYSQVCLYFIIFQGIIYLIEQYMNYWPYKPSGEDFFFNESINPIKTIIVIFLLIFAIPLALALLPFTRFHFSLIVRNSTTIENIDSQNREYARYDLGPSRNLQQVFGKYFIFWFFPCHNKHTRPLGDGVRWSMRCETFHEDVELGNKNKDSLLKKSNQITGNYYVGN